MENKGKIIILDWGMFLHTSIFAWRRNKAIPAEYTCLNMMLSSLRKIGVESYDTIIVACDYGHSWRKEIEKEYKADRAEKRDKYEDIDWKLMYSKFNTLLDRIDHSTDWHIVKENHLEADDWMAVGARYFKDQEVVLVSFDADMEQLCIYPHVKLFSPKIKVKGKKGGYKIIKNPYGGLAKKIGKEQADNLVNPITNEQDYEKRQTVVSLLELPEWVETTAKNKLSQLNKTDYNIDYFPFQSLKTKFFNLYNDKTQIVTYEDCLNQKAKKKKKKNGQN